MRATQEIVPWLDDERLRASVAELARFAPTLPPAAARACIDEASQDLRLYARLQGAIGDAPDATTALRHAARHEALPARPAPEWGRAALAPRVRLRYTARKAEARQLLRVVANDATIGGHVKDFRKQLDEHVQDIASACR